MFHASCILEDSVITIVEVPDKRDENGIPTSYKLVMDTVDRFSGVRDSREVTHVQAGAILALAWGGEDYSPETVSNLYDIANPVVDNMPREVRPIP